jgi:hypothetical protein
MRAEVDVEQAAGQITGSSKGRIDFETQSAIWSMLLGSEYEIREYLSSGSDFYLRHFEELISQLGPRVSVLPWHQFHTRLHGKYISDIEHAAHVLKSLVPEVVLDNEDFVDVRQELEALISEIHTAHLTPTSRATLLYRCSKVTNALDKYPLTGAPGIENAFITFVGNDVVNYGITAELASKGNDAGGLIDRIKKTARAIIFLLATANTIHDAYKNLAAPIEHLFLAQPDPASNFEVPKIPPPSSNDLRDV